MASYSFKQFFLPPSINDKLTLFRRLFDFSELNEDMALALLKVIHHELGAKHINDHSVYKRYAETIETLRFHHADMLKHVVDVWNAGRTAKEPEWIVDGMVK